MSTEDQTLGTGTQQAALERWASARSVELVHPVPPPAWAVHQTDEYADDVTTLALTLRDHDQRGEGLRHLIVAEELLRPRANGVNALAACLATLAEVEPDAERRLARAREAIRLTLALPKWTDASELVDRVLSVCEVLVDRELFDEALRAIREVVARGEQCGVDEDEDLRESLAAAYSVYAALCERGDLTGCLRALARAAEEWRTLATRRPQAHAQALVEALNEQARVLRRVGRMQRWSTVQVELRQWGPVALEAARAASRPGSTRHRAMPHLLRTSWGESSALKTVPATIATSARKRACPCGSGKKYKRCCGR